MMEDISSVRDGMLALVDQIDQHGLSGDIILAHIEDFVELLGRISALKNIDIRDGRRMPCEALGVSSGLCRPKELDYWHIENEVLSRRLN